MLTNTVEFSYLSILTHTLISKGIYHTDEFKSRNYYILRYKLLVSTLALADTRDASRYQLYTPFICLLSFRYLQSPTYFSWITVLFQYVHHTLGFTLINIKNLINGLNC